jgi:hypothetical protein
VLAARRFVEEGRARSNSEHDPEWWTADIEIENILKGKPAATASNRVTVFYANSKDVLWFRSPKLKEGDRGIWIVVEYKPGGFLPETHAPILAVLSPLDSYPLADLDRMGRLVKASQ